MHTVFTYDNQVSPIKLEQYEGKDMFRVTYGLEVHPNLTYPEAAKELGGRIMHAQSCLGAIWMK